MQREHVGFGETCGIDPLARVNLAHGADAVAQLRGSLEIHGFRGVLHVLGELVLDQAALAGEEALRLIHQRRISFGVDPPRAGRAATLDLMQEAGPGATLEHSIRTRAQEKGALQGIEGHVH